MEALRGQEVLVLGLGVSGRSAAAFCAERGARVVAADERPAGGLGAPLDDLERAGVELRLGRPFPDPAGFDLVVPSPGVAPERYRSRAGRVWGDVELAGRCLAVPCVAVTGTNGKTTTATLLAELLRAAGLRSGLAGNVGTPALSLVGAPLDVAVLEVSSFQLETTERFRPAVAVVLNVAPDHLDRHHTVEAYVEAKLRILANQEDPDTAVLNVDDERFERFRAAARGRVLPFRATGPLEHGVWLDAGSVLVRERGDAAPRRLPFPWTRPGAHERENAVAAVAAAFAVGADLSRAVPALERFQGLPHRTQLVARRHGVAWVDDSKATNPGAALRGLESFGAPLVWIAGGRAKGLDLKPLAHAARGRVRAAVLIGESAPELARALEGVAPAHVEAGIEDAVRRAAELARPGDVVLLAPGCSSLDQFRSYEERGDRFRAAALALDGAEEVAR